MDLKTPEGQRDFSEAVAPGAVVVVGPGEIFCVKAPSPFRPDCPAQTLRDIVHYDAIKAQYLAISHACASRLKACGIDADFDSNGLHNASGDEHNKPGDASE